MNQYQDRIDTEFIKTKDDDGEFVYCLPIDRKNSKIIYTPYEMEIISKEEAEKENIYFICSATSVTMVRKKLNMKIFYKKNKIFRLINLYLMECLLHHLCYGYGKEKYF